MKLFCAIVGVAGSAFPVSIDAGESVSALKKAIKAEKTNDFKDIDADKLELFVAKRDGEWLREADVKSGVTDITGLMRLDVVRAKLFSVGLSDEVVSEVDAQEEAAGRGSVNVLVMLPEQHPAARAVFPPNKKRKLPEISDLITPSSFARCRGGGNWVKWLRRLDGQIECHRIERQGNTNYDEEPLPIVLLSATFARFEENCKQIQLCQDDCNFVSKLCHNLSTPYDSEAAFAEKARELLTEYLLAEYPASTITPTTVNGSVSHGSYRFGETLLLNLACRLQKGDGGGDPTMQNLAYYIKTLPRVIDRQYPCLLVDVCGPFISVFGIVNTSDEDAICEPLVMSFPLLFFDNEWLMVSLARMCAALKVAVQELTDACNKRGTSRHSHATRLGGTALDRLRFPYKDSVEWNGADISFQYVGVIQRYVFKARYDGRDVVVKFAKRYGTEVHQHCASAGFAPELLFCESLPNGWVFVVMEQLALLPLRHADGVVVRKQLLKIRKLLQEASFVHGDLRANNVMWDPVGNRVVLIDFDWSGKAGVGTYPPFMNAEIAWSPGAKCGEPLQVAHDACSFDAIIARLT